MEEFWKDITLSPSHQPISAAAITAAGDDVSHTTILQEFLALPADGSGGRAPHSRSAQEDRPPPPPPPPAIALSLNTHRLPFLSPAPDVNSPPPQLHSLTRKRAPDSDGGGDRKHERLMKNRESAARSRARKQAHTHELEMKVAHLRRENARLRRQKDKMSVGISAMPSSKKNRLYRTLTAPF